MYRRRFDAWNAHELDPGTVVQMVQSTSAILGLRCFWFDRYHAPMVSLLDRELRGLGLLAPSAQGQVTEADILPLPEPARRYFRYCGVVGRERVASFRARFVGRFRRAPDARWQTVRTDQYNMGEPQIARLFYMSLRMFGLPIQGRDTYIDGKGRLLIRPLDLFTVEDWTGDQADTSELVTWLNDAVLLAPSMLLHPRTEWTAIDEGAFGVATTDAGHRATATVEVDHEGAVRNFVTEDRWMSGKEPHRASWSTPVGAWRSEGGRKFPASGRATWLLSQGDYNYAEFDMAEGSVDLNPTNRG